MRSNEEITEAEARFVPAMWPKWLPFEKRQEFAERYWKCVLNHKVKWNCWPGYKSRASILRGLYTNYRLGRIGNSAWGRKTRGQKAALALKRKIAASGVTLKEHFRNFRNTKTKAQRAAEEHLKEVLELRRARLGAQKVNNQF